MISVQKTVGSREWVVSMFRRGSMKFMAHILKFVEPKQVVGKLVPARCRQRTVTTGQGIGGAESE